MDFDTPGFMGTNASLTSDVSLVLGIVVALVLTAGMLLAVRKRFGVHRWFQTTAVVLNLLQVIFVMAGQFSRNVAPAVPAGLNQGVYLVPTVHAVLGLVTLLFGTYVMLTGNKVLPGSLRFKNYKPYMRTAYGLYILITLIGVGVYYTWYVAGA